MDLNDTIQRLSERLIEEKLTVDLNPIGLSDNNIQRLDLLKKLFLKNKKNAKQVEEYELKYKAFLKENKNKVINGLEVPKTENIDKITDNCQPNGILLVDSATNLMSKSIKSEMLTSSSESTKNKKKTSSSAASSSSTTIKKTDDKSKTKLSKTRTSNGPVPEKENLKGVQKSRENKQQTNGSKALNELSSDDEPLIKMNTSKRQKAIDAAEAKNTYASRAHLDINKPSTSTGITRTNTRPTVPPDCQILNIHDIPNVDNRSDPDDKFVSGRRKKTAPRKLMQTVDGQLVTPYRLNKGQKYYLR